MLLQYIDIQLNSIKEIIWKYIDNTSITIDERFNTLVKYSDFFITKAYVYNFKTLNIDALINNKKVNLFDLLIDCYQRHQLVEIDSIVEHLTDLELFDVIENFKQECLSSKIVGFYFDW